MLSKFLLRLTALLFAGFVTVATAQQESGRDDGVDTCTSLSSTSRTRAACGEEGQTVLRVEREVTTFNETVELKSRQCATEISVEYFQRDTIARVNGLIENESCAASNGEYIVAVRIKDEDGELQTFEFRESWQRDDDQAVDFTADYAIGENVELIWLRSRSLRCTCSEPVEE